MLDLKLIGSRIKSLRVQRNLTQGSFADILGVSFQAVSNWERGIAPPDLDNLVRIANYFNVKLDELISGNLEECYLGVDGGGTKTEFVVIASDGRVLKRSVTDGSNPNDVGFDNTLRIISRAIKEFVVEFPMLKSVFLGIAGMSVGDYADRLGAELNGIFSRINFKVKTDIFNLFAIDETLNMALISGTGSVAFVRQGSDYRRIGGWGYLLDSAGSAFDIGRDAIRLALKEEDCGQKPSLISTKLCERFKTNTVWEHLNTLYTKGKPYIADLASSVFEAYRMGDENAESIIDSNAKALSELLNLGVKIYGAETRAIANGGLFAHYSDILTHHIKKYCNVDLLISDLPPVYGAAKMALDMDDHGVTESFYDNFKKTYRRI